jgi:hypothetical protein
MLECFQRAGNIILYRGGVAPAFLPAQLLELPVPVVQGAHVAALEPALDAVEVKGMVCAVAVRGGAGGGGRGVRARVQGGVGWGECCRPGLGWGAGARPAPHCVSVLPLPRTALAPGNIAALLSLPSLVGLALYARLHDHVAADGAVVHHNVPGPQRHGAAQGAERGARGRLERWCVREGGARQRAGSRQACSSTGQGQPTSTF